MHIHLWFAIQCLNTRFIATSQYFRRLGWRMDEKEKQTNKQTNKHDCLDSGSVQNLLSPEYEGDDNIWHSWAALLINTLIPFSFLFLFLLWDIKIAILSWQQSRPWLFKDLIIYRKHSHAASQDPFLSCSNYLPVIRAALPMNLCI